MFAITQRKLLLKRSKEICRMNEDSNKNARVDGAVAKLDKTVEEAGFLGVSKTPSKLEHLLQEKHFKNLL